MRSLCSILILISTSIGFAQEQESKPSIYDQGMEIIKKDGVDAGIQFFEEHAVQTGSYRSLFGMAWAYWVDGKLSEANKICAFILKKKPRPVMEAHCNYLLGHIAIVSNDYKQAKVNFVLALTEYKKLERKGDQSKTLLGLAAADILAKEYHSADYYLDQAESLNEEVGKNLGHFYHLKARSAFGQGMFQRALDFSQDALNEYEIIGDHEHQTNAMIDIGFFQMLTGNMKDGLETTYEIAEIISEKKYKKLSYYNAINLIFAYKCSGIDNQELKDQVSLWINSQEDFFLKSLLDFALNQNCP